MDDLKVVVGIYLGRGKDAVFTVDFKDRDRTMRSWELEGAALCAGKTERLPAGTGQFPLDGFSKEWDLTAGKRGLVCFRGHLGSATFRNDRWIHFKTNGATLLCLTSPKRCIYKQHAR
ncbi:hypothetical protein [Rhizobium leguminosarum]|uniref:hypothetical protein n=1 Tax=Rhizobium leguminosarum TaxID=384 RepID=UPI001C92A97C|nr:hypothetical protein [Rhizobium leguminosarum]MBY2950895.1 hypothetical protein [Rhizobium leguminosarum]